MCSLVHGREAKIRKTDIAVDDNETRKSSPIDVLNDDCLIQIFSYLSLSDRSRIERVCKRWQALNSKAWNNFKHLQLGLKLISLENSMHIYEQSINDRSIEKILSRCGRFLSTMTIHSFELACMYILPSIAQYCHNLTCLDLSLDTYTDEDLANVFSNAKKLEYLKLGELYGTFTGDCLANLSIDSIQEIYLVAIGRVELRRIGAESIKKMYRLHKLELQDFKLDADALQYIADNRTINDLSLIHCHLNGGDHIVNMRGLKNLDLYNTTMKISNRSLHYLKTNFPTIQYLDSYQNSYQITSH